MRSSVPVHLQGQEECHRVRMKQGQLSLSLSEATLDYCSTALSAGSGKEANWNFHFWNCVAAS